MASYGNYIVETGVTSTNISGLQPLTAYAIRIQTRNADGDFSPANPSLIVKTAATPPDGPADPAGLVVDRADATYFDAVKLRWSGADENGGAPIDFYQVTWDPPYGAAQPYVVPADPLDPTGDTTAFISSLAANSRYTFTVAAVNTDGSMSPGYARVIGATSSNVGPRDPTNFRKDSNLPPTSNTVYLKWNTAGTQGESDLSGYYITWQPPDGTGSTSATSFATTKAVTGLSASTTYSFNIVAVDTSDYDSPGNYYVSVATIPEGGLLPATNLQVVSAAVTSIDLAWDPAVATDPDYITCNVISAYDTSEGYYLPSQDTPGLSVSNYTFTNLSSNTTYRFEINTFSEAGSNVAGTNTVEGTTSRAGAPFDPSLGITTEAYSNISFVWSLSGDGRNGGANLSDFFIDYYATPDGETLRRNVPGGATASNVTVFNLTSDTEYSFTIYARNLSGFISPGSGNATKIGRTLMAGAPYAPSNVQAHPYIPATPSSISVMWNTAFKGSPANAAVTNHIVRISPPDTFNTDTYNVGEDTTLTIPDLEAEAAYKVWVKAINADGVVGNESTYITLITPAVTGPQDVVGLRTNGVVTDDVVPISWASAGSALAGEPINGYRVTYDSDL